MLMRLNCKSKNISIAHMKSPSASKDEWSILPSNKRSLKNNKAQNNNLYGRLQRKRRQKATGKIKENLCLGESNQIGKRLIEF